MSRRTTRRTILASVSTGAVGIAGCSRRRTNDEAGTDAAERNDRSTSDDATEPSAEGPTITDVVVEPTTEAETVRVEVTASGSKALASVAVASPTDSLSRSVDGTETTLRGTLAAPPMEMSDLTVEATNVAGVTTTRTSRTYARKYDVLADTDVYVAPAYPSFIEDKWHCIEATDPQPAIGQWSLDDPLTVNAHADQMQGHGMSGVMLNYNGTEGQRERFDQWIGPQLSRQITIDCNFALSKIWKWRGERSFAENLNDALDFLRENFFALENFKQTADGRPLLTMWAAPFVAWKEEPREYIQSEWGSYDGFVEHMRTRLSVDGTKPYLITDTPAVVGVGDENFQNFVSAFDAVSTWTQKAHNEDTLDAALEKTRKDFEATRAFADEHDIGFVPTAFPGFDDTGSNPDIEGCWGGHRRAGEEGRSVEFFGAVLDLAKQYRTPTPNKIEIATWSDWVEGSQIEPGSFNGVDYGTDYVDEVARIQRAG
jgi:hypothetical protein